MGSALIPFRVWLATAQLKKIKHFRLVRFDFVFIVWKTSKKETQQSRHAVNLRTVLLRGKFYNVELASKENTLQTAPVYGSHWF